MPRIPLVWSTLRGVPIGQREEYLLSRGVSRSSVPCVLGFLAQEDWPPYATVLNFSSGTGSSCLLWSVIRGEIAKPDRFLVLAADPGAENTRTYEYRQMMFEECRRAGLDYAVAPGPNLYDDLVNLGKDPSITRIDNPPFFTKSADGKKGQLLQKCTRYYKIDPMNRYVRRWLLRKFGVRATRLWPRAVSKWIGFTVDEVVRIKPSQTRYIGFKYPLLELGIRKSGLADWYRVRGLLMPPRSVCNFCFANSPKFYRKMKRDRPEDYVQAVEVDESVRNMRQCGVYDEVYISDRLLPVDEVATLAEDDDSYDSSCDSGYCFI